MGVPISGYLCSNSIPSLRRLQYNGLIPENNERKFDRNGNHDISRDVTKPKYNYETSSDSLVSNKSKRSPWELSLKKIQQMKEPFSNFDAFLLHIETPTNLMVITGLLFIDQPIDIIELQRLIQERILKFERFQQRVVNTGLILKSPKWEFDPTFNINAHVHKVSLPSPGDESALKDLVNDLMVLPMDMSKPPWKLYLVENYSVGSVIVARLHHTLADGLSLVNVFTSLGDDTASSPEGGPPVYTRRKASSLMGRLIVPPLKLTSKVLGLTQWALHQGLEMIDNPDYIKDTLMDATGNALMLSKYVMGKSDPQTSLRGKFGITKNSTWSAPIPLEQIKSLSREFGGTVNDVMLAAVTGGLRRYLEANGEKLDFLDIRAVVPVNIRSNGDFENLGNQVGMVLMPLPVGQQDSHDRYQIVKMRMDDLKQSDESDIIFSLLNTTFFKSKLLATAMVGVLTPKASLLVTNVPGPQGQITFTGRKICHPVFWIPLPKGWGLGISIISYAGEITLGVVVDVNLIPDPNQILEGIEAELEAMHEWAANHAEG
jgi:diacylglycerol O-acyltransferase / wax synthase